MVYSQQYVTHRFRLYRHGQCTDRLHIRHQYADDDYRRNRSVGYFDRGTGPAQINRWLPSNTILFVERTEKVDAIIFNFLLRTKKSKTNVFFLFQLLKSKWIRLFLKAYSLCLNDPFMLLKWIVAVLLDSVPILYWRSIINCLL